MREVDMDAAAFANKIVAVIGVEPVADFDTGEHVSDRDGKPKWKLQVLVKRPEVRKPDVVEIGFAAVKGDVPEIVAGEPVHFQGLKGLHWEQQRKNGGFSSGIAVKCDSFRFGRPTGAKAAA